MEAGSRRWRRVASMAWGRVDGAEVSREVAATPGPCPRKPNPPTTQAASTGAN